MKRMVSIFLTAALLISLLGTTVFAGAGDKIDVTLSLPSIGDTINENNLIRTTSLDDASCLVWKIYSGVSVDAVTAITSLESFTSFYSNDANKGKEATGTYAQEEYVVIFSITSSNITQNSTLSVANLTSGKLFIKENESIFGYVAFTPTDATGSNNNTIDSISNITSSNGSDFRNVYVTYQEGASSPTIYSVDIIWQSMEFTYTAASEGTWDPETHDYTNKQGASWSFANNKITVTNHSNT